MISANISFVRISNLSIGLISNSLVQNALLINMLSNEWPVNDIINLGLKISKTLKIKLPNNPNVLSFLKTWDFADSFFHSTKRERKLKTGISSMLDDRLLLCCVRGTVVLGTQFVVPSKQIGLYGETATQVMYT